MTHKAPIGPMTRSRSKAIQDKVNSLLSLHQFNLSMDDLLPQADMLRILRYEPDGDFSLDMEGKEGDGQEAPSRQTIRPNPPDDPAPEDEETASDRSHRTIRRAGQVPDQCGSPLAALG